MLLEGHQGCVFGIDFAPFGKALASCSEDKTIFLWNVYGDCINYDVLSGHKNAVLDVHWSHDGEYLVTFFTLLCPI